MPEKVLIAIDSLAIGGAERCAVDMAAALDRARFEPVVVTTRGAGQLRATLDQAGIETVVLGRSRTLDPRALGRLRRLIADADLVHAHKATTAAWCALLAGGTPLIAHEHNWSGSGGSWARTAYRRLIGPRAASVLCVSNSVASTVRGFGVASDTISVIPNSVMPGVALPREAARAALGISTASPVVGMVAGLRPEKGHLLALEALAHERAAALDVHLCIVGSGPLEAELRNRALELGVDERVIWASAVPDVQLDTGATLSAGAAYSAAFDVALISSHWEGLPLFALEAMAAGAPLIATEVGELPAVCADSRGMLVPPGSGSAIGEAMTALLADPAAATRVGARGLAYVEATHGFPTLMQRLQDLYDAVLARGTFGFADSFPDDGSVAA